MPDAILSNCISYLTQSLQTLRLLLLMLSAVLNAIFVLRKCLKATSVQPRQAEIHRRAADPPLVCTSSSVILLFCEVAGRSCAIQQLGKPRSARSRALVVLAIELLADQRAKQISHLHSSANVVYNRSNAAEAVQQRMAAPLCAHWQLPVQTSRAAAAPKTAHMCQGRAGNYHDACSLVSCRHRSMCTVSAYGEHMLQSSTCQRDHEQAPLPQEKRSKGLFGFVTDNDSSRNVCGSQPRTAVDPCLSACVNADARLPP